MYVCTNCWNESLKWTWQCSFCKEWNTLTEFKETKAKSWSLKWVTKELKKIEDFENNEKKYKTSSNELNNLLSWWITAWSVILLAWEPGIWKSTLALQIASWFQEEVIYISWEETENQIWQRAKRLWITANNISLLSENNLEDILETIKNSKSHLIILDSISVITSQNATWSAWSITQVKEVAEKFVEFSKSTNTTTIIIWHVNKEWNLAWPKTLEHLVDTVLYFEWERYEDVRMLRSLKNRFGWTWEVAIFKMQEDWLHDLENPGLEFISKENDNKTIGSSLSITIEWTRPLVVEIESLTTYTKFGYPKRSAKWINTQKLDLILAVLGKYTIENPKSSQNKEVWGKEILSKWAYEQNVSDWDNNFFDKKIPKFSESFKINLDSYDVYVNIVRWIKVFEPWIDLSIWASIISSKSWKSIPRNSIFIWEISLTWRIKNCFNLEKRIKEAIRLWFENIYIPDVEVKVEWKANIVKLKDIKDLVGRIVG